MRGRPAPDRRTDLYRRVADLEAEGELDFGTDADTHTHGTYRAPEEPDSLDDAEEVLGTPAAAGLSRLPHTSSAVAVRIGSGDAGARTAAVAGSTAASPTEMPTDAPTLASVTPVGSAGTDTSDESPRDDHPLL